MKKLFTMTLAALALLAVSCGKPGGGDDNTGELLEINEANLAGTWESDVFTDFAQGYTRKYRIAFDGNTFTLWKAYQEYLKEKGQEGKLYLVGDKYAGTWAVNEGLFAFTVQDWKASHYITADSYNDYIQGKTYAVVYPFSIETMEAETWYQGSNGSILDDWRVISLSEKELKVRVNMDNVVLKKK